MFGFFGKKKAKKTVDKVESETVLLTAEESERLAMDLEKIMAQIDAIEKSEEAAPDNLAALYEEAGLILSSLGELDKSMDMLEKSLDSKLSIGAGYKKLMSLYNAKRAEAARAGDDNGIAFYMDKMDDMRQIAKKVTITGSN